MKKILDIILAAILCFIISCQNVSEKPVEKDGKIYGVTKGAFLDRWWDYYERGLSFADGGFWQEAEKDFREALKMWDTDHFRTRTYGRHLMDYFPHRELGVIFFHQNRYDEAIKELETSLSSEKSAKAEYYLDKTRKLQIEQEHSDIEQPQVFIEFPATDMLINKLMVDVRGIAGDDTFVKAIRINGEPVRIDLSAPRISFQMQIPLKLGKNRISVEAKDLTDKIGSAEKYVFCDLSGPILNIDPPSLAEGKYRIKGYALDTSGIRKISLDHFEIETNHAREFSFNHPISLPVGQKKILVTAEDMLGNTTRAEIPMQLSSEISQNDTRTLLASLYSDASDYRGIDNEKKKQKRTEDYLKNSRYYTLIIGINDYEEWEKLSTAVNDATALKEILIGRCGFPEKDIVLRTDKAATRETLLRDIREIASRLSENDNLLVYFAGHGTSDSLTGNGYWIPADGKSDDRSTWITHYAIKEILGSPKVAGKHILVIADSCYSGTFLKEQQGISAESRVTLKQPETISKAAVRGQSSAHGGLPAPKSPAERASELAMKRSRQILASGGIQTVSDKGFGNHSLFAYYLLEALKKNPYDIIDIEYLVYTYVWRFVDKGGQRPVIGRIQTAMDEDGQFVFVSDKGSIPEPQKEPDIPVFERSGDTEPPVIEVMGADEQKPVFAERIFLEIHTHDKSGIQYLSVNGEKIVNRPGQDIHINHTGELKEGDNLFVIEVSDQVGNKGRKEIHIHRKTRNVFETGSRMSVVLLPFDIKGNRISGVEAALTNHLIADKRFCIKEKKAGVSKKQIEILPWIRNVISRQKQEDDSEEIARAANASDADFVLKGDVIANEKSLDITVRVVDPVSFETLSSQNVYGEEVSQELVRTLCRGLTIKLRDDFPLVEGQIVTIKNKDVLINLGEESRIKKGMKVIFFEEGRELTDPANNTLIGTDFETLGIARVQQLLPKMSYTLPLDMQSLSKLRTGSRLVTK